MVGFETVFQSISERERKRERERERERESGGRKMRTDRLVKNISKQPAPTAATAGF